VHAARPYKIPNYYSEFTAVFTTKPIVTPVRGAGRQHGVFVIERLLDIARESSTSIASRSAAATSSASAISRTTQDHFQDFQPLVYDSATTSRRSIWPLV